ncbi:9006_t:CDS:2, partial [Dentiscutata erythropus]
YCSFWKPVNSAFRIQVDSKKQWHGTIDNFIQKLKEPKKPGNQQCFTPHRHRANRQLTLAFGQHYELIWDLYLNCPPQTETTANLIISSIKQTPFSIPTCTIESPTTNTQLNIQNNYWPSIANVAYTALLVLITIVPNNTQIKISTNSSTKANQQLQKLQVELDTNQLNTIYYQPIYYNIPTFTNAKELIKQTNIVINTNKFILQNRVQNWNAHHNIDWNLTFDYLEMKDKPTSRSTDPKLSKIKNFKIKLLMQELPNYHNLYTRHPSKYLSPECRRCGHSVEDDPHWLTCEKNEKKIEDLIANLLNKFTNKFNLTTRNQSDYINKFTLSYISKKLPVGAIHAEGLPPFSTTSNARLFAPQFYHELTEDIHRLIWLPSRIQSQTNTNITPKTNNPITQNPIIPSVEVVFKVLIYFFENYRLDFLYSVSQMSNLIIIRVNAITEPSLSCDIGGEISPTFLTMNLFSIVIFAFDTIWKNFLRIDSQRFRIILWSTIFAVSWIASTFGLNRYAPLELWCARRLYTPLTDYMNLSLIMTCIISAISLYFQLNSTKSHDLASSYSITFISGLILVYIFQWLCFLFSNILLTLNLENSSATFQTFFSVVLFIGAHCGAIFNSILLSIKKFCDRDLDDDETNNIEKDTNYTASNINNENEKVNDTNSTKLVLTSAKSYGTMYN